ncbi:hypothetical protein ACQJBY_046447 [Aegilops geniculata]
MQILRRNLLEASRRLSSLLHSPPPAAHAHAHAVATLSAARRDPSTGSLAATPWAATQRRGAKMLGSDVKLGNVIQRRGDKIASCTSRKRRSHNTGGTEGC